ncbi:MAG TPA: glycosyltransferase, partial [Pyrinomonadaceae bacterium]|nr:glycosyltransferase [Pyrinomonadaceae bacterium]
WITHQTGEADFERVKEAYVASGWEKHADVRRYIDDMVVSFANADLVICRAGATTTAELIAAGKASIMIPFPLAADDHQRKNAEALVAKGAARMILQQDLTPTRLAKEIEDLVLRPDEVRKMEAVSRGLARGDAAASVVDLIEGLLRSRGRRKEQEAGSSRQQQ